MGNRVEEVRKRTEKQRTDLVEVRSRRFQVGAGGSYRQTRYAAFFAKDGSWCDALNLKQDSTSKTFTYRSNLIKPERNHYSNLQAFGGQTLFVFVARAIKAGVVNGVSVNWKSKASVLLGSARFLWEQANGLVDITFYEAFQRCNHTAKIAGMSESDLYRCNYKGGAVVAVYKNAKRTVEITTPLSKVEVWDWAEKAKELLPKHVVDHTKVTDQRY